MSSLPASRIPLLKIKVQEKGRIKDIKEIICRIDGLPTCLNGQIVDMGDGIRGIVMGYDEHEVLAFVLGDTRKLRMGKDVFSVSEPFRIPVGQSFISRMVTALGGVCDGGPELEVEEHVPVFHDSAPITHRAPVQEPLPSGTKMVDIFIPLAKGQRQLILGDRMTGKTVVALDAVINQRGRNVICIYCCIGKSVSSLEKVMSALRDAGALGYTLTVAAADNASVGEQYIAPFSAASMAEFFARQGRDVLVVFDDLTKHAWAYRQLSLLFERPPGREAYPGDIFYVQAQLMERAGKFNAEHGGGSITFLGIAETLQGDLTGYIPSNLASMCDGQVCLSSAIFAEGFRPAIDLTHSLSIIGGRAQPPIIKDLSGSLRVDYARYTDIVKLSRMGAGLSGDAERIVHKGEAILATLQQGPHQPVSAVEEVLLLYGLDKGFLIGATKADRDEFRRSIFPFAQETAAPLLAQIEEQMELTEAIRAGLDRLMEAYRVRAGLDARR